MRRFRVAEAEAAAVRHLDILHADAMFLFPRFMYQDLSEVSHAYGMELILPGAAK
jgi:hypothetical protein